jgi:hypothetical protein
MSKWHRWRPCRECPRFGIIDMDQALATVLTVGKSPSLHLGVSHRLANAIPMAKVGDRKHALFVGRWRTANSGVNVRTMFFVQPPIRAAKALSSRISHCSFLLVSPVELVAAKEAGTFLNAQVQNYPRAFIHRLWRQCKRLNLVGIESDSAIDRQCSRSG